MIGHSNSVQFEKYLICALNSAELQSGGLLAFALGNDTM